MSTSALQASRTRSATWRYTQQASGQCQSDCYTVAQWDSPSSDMGALRQLEARQAIYSTGGVLHPGEGPEREILYDASGDIAA